MKRTMPKLLYSHKKFSKNLEILKDREGIATWQKFELEIEMPGATYRWRTGRDNPTPESLLKIKKRFGVSIDWLLTGEEPKEKEIYQPIIIIPGKKPEIPPGIRADEYYAVPLVSGRIAAGHIGAIPSDLYDELVLVYKPQVGRLQHHNLRAVKLADDAISMEPTIQRGSIVIIDPEELNKPLSSNAIYAVRLEDTEGECVIKRVYDYPEDWVLISDNPIFKPIHVAKRRKPHLLIGRVIWFWTSLVR